MWSRRVKALIYINIAHAVHILDRCCTEMADYLQLLHILWNSAPPIMFPTTIATVRHWLLGKSLACLTDRQITHVLTITNLYDQRTPENIPYEPQQLHSCGLSEKMLLFVRYLYWRYVARHRICNICRKLSNTSVAPVRWVDETLTWLWQTGSGSPTRLTPSMDMIWSPMFSRPVRAAGPEGIRFASTTVGSMLPQPDSTSTMPSGSPFNFVIVTYNVSYPFLSWTWLRLSSPVPRQLTSLDRAFN